MFTYEFDEINTNRGKRIEARNLQEAEKVLENPDNYLLLRVFYPSGELLFDAWSGMLVEVP